MTRIHLTTPDEAMIFAATLRNPRRDAPVVLVSVAAGEVEPFFDVDRIEREVGSFADVAVIPTGAATFALSDALAEGCGAYGGAARVYPTGTAWLSDPWQSPLRIAHEPDDGARLTPRLIADAMRLRAAARSTVPTRPRSSPVQQATVKFVADDGSRAVVAPATGGVASIAQEDVAPGVPLTWLLEPGLRLAGRLDGTTGWFRLDRPTAPLGPIDAYRDGDVVLALVAGVKADAAHLLVHPWVAVDVRLADVTSNPNDELTMLLTEGEVVAAHLRLEDGTPSLVLRDVDDDTPPVPAVPLVPGAPAWLEVDRHLSGGDAAVPDAGGDTLGATPASAPTRTPAQHPPSPADLARVGGTVRVVAPASEPAPAAMGSTASDRAAIDDAHADLRDRLEAAGAHIAALETELAAARSEGERHRVAAVRASAAALARQFASGEADEPAATPARAGAPAPAVAPDAGAAALDAHDDTIRALTAERTQLAGELGAQRRELEQLRAERTQLRRQLRSSRRERPDAAPPYGLDPDSFVDADDIVRHAVRRAWVELVPAGEKREFPLRDYDLGAEFAASLLAFEPDKQRKALRVIVALLTGRTQPSQHHLRQGEAGGPRLRDTDGATAWRVYLEENSPQARRLHYWLQPGGRIELAKVVLHDDMSI